MYSRLSRLIVLFAMLICLPLNGLAAVTMPACDAHGQSTILPADDGQMKAMPGCDHHESKPQPGKTPCDKCLSCHVISAQVVVPFLLPMPMMAMTPKFFAESAEKLQSVSSSLFRPPISAFA